MYIVDHLCSLKKIVDLLFFYFKNQTIPLLAKIIE
jgi:hypothetical protein